MANSKVPEVYCRVCNDPIKIIQKQINTCGCGKAVVDSTNINNKFNQFVALSQSEVLKNA